MRTLRVWLLVASAMVVSGCVHTATLQVTSVPTGAAVTIDGNEVGRTPVRVVRTGRPTSRAEIVVSHPDYAPILTWVDLDMAFGLATFLPGLPGEYGLEDDAIHVDLEKRTATLVPREPDQPREQRDRPPPTETGPVLVPSPVPLPLERPEPLPERDEREGRTEPDAPAEDP